MVSSNFILNYFKFISRRMLGALSELLLLTSVLLFWILAKQFAHNVQKNESDENSVMRRKLKWLDLSKQFRELKQLGVLINQLYGAIVTIYIVNFIAEYTLVMDEIVEGGSGPKAAFNVLAYVISASAILIISADVSRQVTLKIIFIRMI